ncbi:uncharacterized protein NPIL_647291 [Nephila pilipes]|uniref:Uncharacterized protein n=1 Tax=Nephila pilipes TaxID=299642 RepID=A0A8X6T9C4_NEPPI|nr:uncharacterized protein NPIL_647291 [Nephila pilipes]
MTVDRGIKASPPSIMAERSELAYINTSDNEILKALTLSDDLRKSSYSNSEHVCSDVKIKLTFESDTESLTTTVSESSADSGFHPSSSEDLISLCNMFKFDSEYETVCRDIQNLDLMCDLFIETNQKLEAQYRTFMKGVLDSGQKILSESFLNEKCNEINNVIIHIVTISNKMCRIQQVLQDKPWETTMKVDPSCQKAVLKFFYIAGEIMKKVQVQAEYIENYRKNKIALVSETNDKELQSRLHNVILELAKRIDVMSRFRDNVSLLLDQKTAIVTSSNPDSEVT